MLVIVDDSDLQLDEGTFYFSYYVGFTSCEELNIFNFLGTVDFTFYKGKRYNIYPLNDLIELNHEMYEAVKYIKNKHAVFKRDLKIHDRYYDRDNNQRKILRINEQIRPRFNETQMEVLDLDKLMEIGLPRAKVVKPDDIEVLNELIKK